MKTLEELQNEAKKDVSFLLKEAAGPDKARLEQALSRLEWGERASLVLLDTGVFMSAIVRTHLYNLASWAYAEEVVDHKMSRYDVTRRLEYVRKQKNI